MAALDGRSKVAISSMAGEPRVYKVRQANQLKASQVGTFLNRFDFFLSNRPGSKNVKPDALSHLFEPAPNLPALS